MLASYGWIKCTKEFDYEKDLDILRSKKTDPDNAGYTTVETMASLNYKNKDVYNELILLTEQDYGKYFVSRFILRNIQ